MSNVLSEQLKQQVIVLGQLGWSLRGIQKETGVRRETASIYLKAAGIAVPSPGRRKEQPAKPAIPMTTGLPAELSLPPNDNPNPNPFLKKGQTKTAKPAISLTTGFGVESGGSQSETPKLTASSCEPYREAIELGLRRGRNAMAIWQDLVADTAFHASYQSVKRFVRKLHGNHPLEARAVISTPPGEEAQVDYGTGPMVRDPQTGKYRRTRLFVMSPSPWSYPQMWPPQLQN